MTFNIVIGSWEERKADAMPIRLEVFVQEQRVPIEMEQDEMDPLSLHAVAYDSDGKAIATGRLLPDGHIGRMAVLADLRGHGLGSALLEALMAEAAKRGDRAVVLNAQTHAEPFYRRYGFTREGEEFMEAGIPHIEMRCLLKTLSD